KRSSHRMWQAPRGLRHRQRRVLDLPDEHSERHGEVRRHWHDHHGESADSSCRNPGRTRRHTMTQYVGQLVHFIIAALIAGGGAITTAMVATGSTALPSKGTLLFGALTGIIAGAKDVQALLATPPSK